MPRTMVIILGVLLGIALIIFIVNGVDISGGK